MSKSTHFIGQPMYGQLLNLLDKQKILRISREKGGERYVKRFDSLREISASMLPEARRSSCCSSSSSRTSR